MSVDDLVDSTRDTTHWRKLVAKASVCAAEDRLGQGIGNDDGHYE